MWHPVFAAVAIPERTEPGIFDVFSLGDPALELWSVAKYMILPLAVGTLGVRLVMHGFEKMSERQLGLSPWPFAAMLTMVLSPIYVVGLVVSKVTGQPTFAHFATAVVVALFLTAPGLVVLVPVFAIYVRDGTPDKPALSDKVVYAFVLFCLFAEYFWIGSILRSNFH